MEKKNLAIIILVVVLAASGIGNIILAVMSGAVKAPEDKNVLKVATSSNPVTFDPIDTWDSVSNDVLNQICETLIFFDYPTMSLVPALAVSWSWDDDPAPTELTLILRQNIVFHDNTPFNAAAVKWNFDRLNYFGNSSGTLPAGELVAHPASIYQFNATTPIMKTITVNSEYNVTIELSKAFTPFEGLLSYTGSAMVSPTAHEADEYIDLATDLPVGTGPYKLINYEPDQEIRFERWPRWWKQGVYFDEVVYVYYADSVTANNAMLALDIDYLGEGMASVKSQFVADDDIHVEEVGTATIYWYVSFNNVAVNITWRKAIQHAFNYTYFLVEIEEGVGIRGRNLVPPGFPGRNDSVMAADYDIPAARQFLKDDGIAPASWDIGEQTGDVFTPGANEADWKGAHFRDLNFRTRPGSNFYQLLLAQFSHDMEFIGLDLTEQAMEWPDYITQARLNPEYMNIFFTGWGPDYFETFNMIDPLVNPASGANYAQISVPEINDYLALASAETDEAQRYLYYEKLQSLIHDKYYVHMPLEYNLLYSVHAESLKGFPYNINRDLYWFSCYRE